MLRMLSPEVYSYHLEDELRQYIDLSGQLPAGVTIASASVTWWERTDGRPPIERTALFGSPEVDVDPPQVPASGGGTQGGPGWLAFQPVTSEGLRADRYEMRLRVTLTSGEVVNFGRLDEL